MPSLHWLLLCLGVIVIKPGFVQGHQSWQEIIWIATKKITNIGQTTGTVDVFWSAIRHFGTHFAESFRMSNSSWMMDPTRSREMPSCSVEDLAEIRRSSKMSSWIWSIMSRVITVLGRPGQGASQVGKSAHLNWATQFLTAAYDGACSPNVSVRMAWISFGVLPYRKRNWIKPVSRCCWNRARRLTCFLSAFATRKNLQFGTRTESSFQRHHRFRPTKSGSRSG